MNEQKKNINIWDNPIWKDLQKAFSLQNQKPEDSTNKETEDEEEK